MIPAGGISVPIQGGAADSRASAALSSTFNLSSGSGLKISHLVALAAVGVAAWWIYKKKG